MKTAHCAALLALILVATSSVQAQRLITTDTTQDGGTFVVNPAGTLTISDASNPLLTLTGGAQTLGITEVNIGSIVGGQGQLLVEQGSTLSNSSHVLLDRTATAKLTGSGSKWLNGGSLSIDGDSTLTIENGGVLNTRYESQIGFRFEGNGSAIVTGNGSKWQNNNNLIIGNAGTGNLTVENGGVVTSNGTSYLGNTGVGKGTATVAGAGSQWLNNGELHVGENGTGLLTIGNGGLVSGTDLIIGKLGAGNIKVESGGQLVSNKAYLGQNADSTGEVLVTGTNSTWLNKGNLYVNAFYVEQNTGKLTVENGGGVLNLGNLYASMNNLLGNGTVITNGAFLDNANLVFDSGSQQPQIFSNGGKLLIGSGDLGIGYTATSSLTVSNGAKLQSANSTVGYNPRSNGAAVVTGTGSQWKSTGDLIVGRYGTGALTIENGGTVSSTNSTLGWQTDSIATVIGAGSQWQNSDTLRIGEFRTGVLKIQDGGFVTSNNAYLGNYSNSEGDVVINGAGSTWRNNNGMLIGDYGIGTLTIEDGGRATTGNTFLGASNTGSGMVKVSGDGSQWQYDNLSISNKGIGSLTIDNGGLVVGRNATVGEFGIASAKVAGTKSQWQNSGDLILGYQGSGSGNLSIENGGLVANQNAYLGFFGTGTATVTGSGSQWRNDGNLTVGLAEGGGYRGTGTLTVADGGEVTVEGTLYATKSDLAGNGKITTHGAVLDADLVMNNGSQQIVTTFGNGGQLIIGTGDLGIGYKAAGTLTVSNGAFLQSSNGYLGYAENSTGKAHITGAGSQWQIGDILVVGDYGAGTLIIDEGGLVTSLNANLGANWTSSATAIISGTGSQWRNVGQLGVGQISSAGGQLIVENGGRVEVGGVLTIGAHGTLSGNGGTIIGDINNQGLISPGNSPGVLTIDGDLTSTGILKFELAGTGSGLFDQLFVSGDFELGGVVEIDLLDGFTPGAHSQFKLIDFGSFDDREYHLPYQFDFTHAALGAGLSWDTSTFAVDGTVRVVPEAGSLIMVGIGALAGVVHWRTKSRSR